MAKFLITVVGPTGIGKTALAIKLAQHYNCEILSADSRQFFREMSVGTAVPSAEELAAAPHHFIHHKSISESYTVGDFEKEALSTLEKLFTKSDYAILVGGSGLYIDAILRGLDEFPEVSPEVKELVRSKYQKSGLEYLRKELQKRDPLYFETVDKDNPQRMMRALEVCKSSGRPYSSFLGGTRERNFTPILIGLEADRKLLYERINQRVDLMLANGLVEEARTLISHRDRNALQTVGYRELFSYFSGDFSYDFAVSEVKKNTRRFAKRQLTWFRRNPNIKWFDFKADVREIVSYIDSSAQKA